MPVIGPIRFTYCAVFEPKPNQSGVLKYSTGILIDKNDKNLITKVKSLIDAAVAKGIQNNKFSAAQSKSAKFKYPLRDGDEFYTEQPGADREAYKGNLFMNASNSDPIGVIDKFGHQIINRNEFYSGCYGLADVSFFPFNTNGSIGVGLGLNNVMKKSDGERLDGRQDAQTAFADFVEPEGEDPESELK